MTTDKTKPLVSVIVPVYKVENYLNNCLDSLISQTYSDWEAILVDDGSPDRSGEICDEYALRDKRFKVIHKENGGLSSARNAGILHAEGEYIFYLDSDDYLHCDTLGRLIDIAVRNNADIVQCDFLRGVESVFPDINITEAVSVYDNKSIFTSFAAKIITCGKLYRRSTIGNIKFPEGLVNEDDFTTWKFYYNANNIAVTDNPFYYYTCNPESIMAHKAKRPNFKYFDAYRERIEFFQNENESDLEAVSRIQWMKSLVMTYSNPMLTEEQKAEVLETFKSNYDSLSMLDFTVPEKLSTVFRAFRIAPMLTSKVVLRIYNR